MNIRFSEFHRGGKLRFWEGDLLAQDPTSGKGRSDAAEQCLGQEGKTQCLGEASCVPSMSLGIPSPPLIPTVTLAWGITVPTVLC